jgi:hypothetical protein
MHEAMRSFFIPYLGLRNQRRGYTVSIVKAGLRVVGRSAGPVRGPLLDLTVDQEVTLAGLVAHAMTAMKTYGQPSDPGAGGGVRKATLRSTKRPSTRAETSLAAA